MKNNTLEFIKKHMPFTPHKYQRELLEKIMEGEPIEILHPYPRVRGFIFGKFNQDLKQRAKHKKITTIYFDEYTPQLAQAESNKSNSKLS